MSKSPDKLFPSSVAGRKFPRQCNRFLASFRGFTLIELLLVVAAIAVLGGLGVVVVSNVEETSRVNKLENDVAVINSAIQVYKINGGSFEGTPTVDMVLAKLKAGPDAASAARLAGFRGRVIDLRLKAEEQTAVEGLSGQARAIWNATDHRFEIANSGAAGVKRFVLDDDTADLTYAAESRTVSNPLGTETAWVWDYSATEVAAPAAPVVPVASSASGPAAPTAPGVQSLASPTFSPAPGLQLIFDFPISVTLNNPNPNGVSQLWYNTGSGEVLYTGASISVGAGNSVSARARTIDPDRWADSDPATGEWTGEPYQLVVGLTTSSDTVTYQQAGGAMPGAPEVAPVVVTAQITNAGPIPVSLQSSDEFQVFWTYDGSDPLTSASAVSGGGFENGVIAFEIDATLARWAAGSSALTIRAAARAVNATIFASSAVDAITLSIAPTVLLPPYIDPPSTPRSADLPVYIYESIAGFYPPEARAYYAIAGVDPGVSGGEPASGTLYTGAFTVGSNDGSGIITARYYGPAGLSRWFTPSEPQTSIYTVGAGGTGAIVGDSTLNGIYIGSLILTSTKNFNLNNGAIIKAGNLFVRGTPTVDTSNGGVIEGRQFRVDGTEVIPATDTRQVVDLDGPATPSNYTIRLNQGSVIEGRIFRRVNIFVPPPVPEPPPPTGSGNLNISSQPTSPISPTQAANINLNSGAGNVELLPGNWGDMKTGSGTSFVIGVVGSTEPTVYNFQGLTLNSDSSLIVVGPVILTVDRGISLNSSVMGNPDHPEWLDLRVHSGNVTINSSAAGHAALNAPDSNVSLSGIFTGSVIAKTLTINGAGVAITQATVTDEG